MVHICNCIPARLPQALLELPETLDETYERTLQGIDKANWEFAHRMFQFVAVASRPLYVKELSDLLAFDFKAGSIPKFYEDWRLEDSADAVLSTCSTLLAIVNDRGLSVIQFSHFSVKEFLTSTRLVEATDIISRRYHVSMTPAHTLVAQACLGILLHLDMDVTRDGLKDFPLAEYAAEYWVDHARFEEVSRNAEDGMKRLFDPRKPHLLICVWICDPAVPNWTRIARKETPLPLPQTSMHYAASWGLHPVVEFLIIEHSQDVCSRDSTDNATPLHLASRNGHVKAACKLIEHGADAAAQDKAGEAPLHLASRRGEVDVACMLIERGADPTAQNNKGETPLHLALQSRQVDVARMLVERGADPEAQTKFGLTPLHLASREGEVDVGRMLIERGADPTAQDDEGETPLHLASREGQVDIARMLIERGANLSAPNNKGKTPLHLASQMGRVDVARMLVERGADPEAQTKFGLTPLHLASRDGEVDVGRMLIERGADPTAQDNEGETPLHLALKWGELDVARMLIERGADPKAQNNEGKTPLHLASDGGQVYPFPQFQAQPQPTGVLQPQFTAVPGAPQQSSNPFPTSSNALQSQMTGANTFRASMLPMQVTGFSPFGRMNIPLPVPMVPDPFSAQNGLLGTNPFPTSPTTHPTNPFPGAAQTMNPFPAAANPNSFTVPTNNSVPNVMYPNQFLSPNSNPFPSQSVTASQLFPFLPACQPPLTNLSNQIIPAQTSNLTELASGPVPACPASTPLAHGKPSCPPPQPLELHQTGSRNLSWMLNRDAPSPPPVPRAPTFFEFAMGMSQAQPQSQSTGLGVSSSTTGVGTAGLGGSFGLSMQLTSSPPATTLGVGSSIGVGLGTGFGLCLCAANPFRSSAMTQSLGSAAGTVPLFKRDGGLSAPEFAQCALDRELNSDPEARQRQDLPVNDLTSMVVKKNEPVAVTEASGAAEKRKAEDEEVQTSQNKKARLEESPAP